VEKRRPKIWATFAIFKKTTQSKQLTIRRKLAQSGHTEKNVATFSGLDSIIPKVL
jgi:hypothetical protein